MHPIGTVPFGLPESLLGTIAVSSVIEAAQKLLENHFSGKDISDISVEDIANALPNVGIDAVNNIADKTLLAEVIKRIFGDVVGFSGKDCTTINVGYSTILNNNQYMRCTIGCTFSVCAILKRGWNLIRYITDWAATGNCAYTCADGTAGLAAGLSHICKDHGLECNGKVSISGSGRGVWSRCTVNP